MMVTKQDPCVTQNLALVKKFKKSFKKIRIRSEKCLSLSIIKNKRYENNDKRRQNEIGSIWSVHDYRNRISIVQ